MILVEQDRLNFIGAQRENYGLNHYYHSSYFMQYG